MSAVISVPRYFRWKYDTKAAEYARTLQTLRDARRRGNRPGDASRLTSCHRGGSELARLQDNGGQTRTMAPLAGSPAIDTGTSGGLPTDQIGQLRTVTVSGIVNAATARTSAHSSYNVRSMCRR